MSLMAAYIVCHPPLIIPEIGKGEELKIKKTIESYERIASMIAQISPQTIIFISPHADIRYDSFNISPGKHATGSFRMFGAPRVSFSVTYDEVLAGKIEKKANERKVPVCGHNERMPELDHATMVPLYFINTQIKDFSIVRLAPSMRNSDDHYTYGKAIYEAIKDYDQDVVIIASGDLSHVLDPMGPYGFAEEGPIFDHIVIDAIREHDLKRLLTVDEKIAAKAKPCGLSSFQILAGAIDSLDMHATLESYERPFGVGYAMARFDRSDAPKALCHEKRAYAELAKASIVHYLMTKTYLSECSLKTSLLLSKRAGVFVTLKKKGRLRGCIGTIAPAKRNVYQEIIHNAVSAAVHDPRFPPVTLDEIASIELSIDVLGPTEPIESIDRHDVDRYGIIVSLGNRKGLLLPGIDSVRTAEEQLEIALMKAGISDDEPYIIERFEVTRYE